MPARLCAAGASHAHHRQGLPLHNPHHDSDVLRHNIAHDKRHYDCNLFRNHNCNHVIDNVGIVDSNHNVDHHHHANHYTNHYNLGHNVVDHKRHYDSHDNADAIDHHHHHGDYTHEHNHDYNHVRNIRERCCVVLSFFFHFPFRLAI